MTHVEESEGGAVAEDVRRKILDFLGSGTWQPGQKLGSEREMAEQFGVSRATLRSALLPLHRAGLLDKRAGRTGGTFVGAGVVERHVAELVGLPTRLSRTGHSSTTQVLDTALREASPIEARALRIYPGTPLVWIRRLRYADQIPLSIDHARFVASRFPGLLGHPLSGSLYALIENEYGVQLAQAEESIQIVNAKPREASLLNVSSRSPLLAMTRIGTDDGGTPFEYSEDYFRADRVRLISRSDGSSRREAIASDGRFEVSVSG